MLELIVAEGEFDFLQLGRLLLGQHYSPFLALNGLWCEAGQSTGWRDGKEAVIDPERSFANPRAGHIRC